MTVVLDHTIVPVNDSLNLLNLDFRQDEDFRSIHYAFAMEPDEFEGAFQRVKDAKIPYGDSPFSQDNMQGLGISPEARGE